MRGDGRNLSVRASHLGPTSGYGHHVPNLRGPVRSFDPPRARRARGAPSKPPKGGDMNDQLRHAMDAVDLAEIDALATEIGATAVRTALAVQEPDARHLEEEARQKAEAEA